MTVWRSHLVGFYSPANPARGDGTPAPHLELCLERGRMWQPLSASLSVEKSSFPSFLMTSEALPAFHFSALSKFHQWRLRSERQSLSFCFEKEGLVEFHLHHFDLKSNKKSFVTEQFLYSKLSWLTQKSFLFPLNSLKEKGTDQNMSRLSTKPSGSYWKCIFKIGPLCMCICSSKFKKAQ